MKKMMIITSITIIILFMSSIVKAESFYEGEYITSYVKKVKDGKTYYLQMQTIREKDTEKLVYCLEPFEFLEENATYNRIDNLNEYKLTKEQINNIKKIIYYGYGYLPANRRTYTWYVVTQVLIWQEVDKDAEIYFTTKLNGTTIDTSYNTYINDIKRDIGIERSVYVPGKEYKIEYGNDLNIPFTTKYFNITSSDYEINKNTNGITVNNITKSGNIQIEEQANSVATGNTIIYESNGTQDIIIPGALEEKKYNVSVKVLEGDILLNITEEKDVYSIEANLENTCYQIKNSKDIVIETVCANKEYKYKTNIIPHDTYKIEQISIGKGYEKDNNIYYVTINETNPHGIVDLNNKLIKNNIKINKKYCKNNICQPEQDAVFEVYDNSNNLVSSYITNELGNLEINIGYGHYTIIQTSGIDNYELSESINDFIEDSTSIHYYEIKDNYIEEKEEEEEIIIPKKEVEEEIIIPKKEIEEEIKIDEVRIEEPIIPEETIVMTSTKNFEENIVVESDLKDLPPNTSVYKIAKKIASCVLDIIRKYAKHAVLL